MLIFTVERFNSAVHHREAHFCFALVARLAERLNLMRLVFRDEVIMYHGFTKVKYLKYILINQLVQLVIIL